VLAVLNAVAIALALIEGLCSTLSPDGLDLVNWLPKYRDNIHASWAAIQEGPSGTLNLTFSNIVIEFKLDAGAGSRLTRIR
jgi:hypothetical protein